MERRQFDDTESLQADVMRFMAIIAFCLIAILALVQKLPEQPRNSESQSAAVTSQARHAASDSEPAASVEPETRSEVPQPDAAEVAPLSDRDTAAGAPAADRPLILRFESDGVFLRLIGSEQIRLICQLHESYLVLAGDFTLHEVKPAGQLYEVLAETLPRTVRDTIARKGEAQRYLLSLPEFTQQQISSLTEKYGSEGGELIINHRAEVTYAS